MNYIKQVWNDFIQGKNTGLIITMVLAVTIPILKFFIPALDKHIPSLTLAVLALLANGLLLNRYQMEKLFYLNEKIAESGFKDIHNENPESRINKLFENSKREICILWTWNSQIDPLPTGLITAAKLGVKVRILLTKPNSPTASQRLVDLGFERKSTRPQIALDGIMKIIQAEQLQDKLHIRFYDALPPFILRSVDDTMFVGFLWYGAGSSKGPHIELRNTSKIGQHITDTFEKIWDNSSSKPE